jgi:5'-AMP-activated protein kinase catalytic alpha subunit
VAHQRLDEEEASYFFYQLINGLDYIHHKNIVHRDLKPENLLLGKGNILKIVDFGLSNYYDKEKLLSTPCGSPCYASPEMVCGNKYNGFLIDIWACGIIIFAMICGFLPFEDINNEILFKKIMKCKVEYPEFLSNTVVDIMKKILVIDTKKRITIPEIRKHPFYLKGKNIFEKKHNNLVYQVERIISENNIESKEIYTNKSFSSNINKSKSTNFIDNDNIIDKKIEYKKCLNKIINKRTTNKENNSFKNNSNKGLI